MAATQARFEQLPSAGSNDWAVQFLSAGCKGEPWVVLERLPGDPQLLRRDLYEDTDGWLFGAWSHRILHAPTYDVYAPEQVQLSIVEGIRQFPARRAAEFQTFERPMLEARGWPTTLFDQTAPCARLDTGNFKWPVLLVAADPDTGKHLLLGSVSSMDLLLPGLVRRPDVPVDDALALLVLLTCHGDPGVGFAKSPFTRPLHPKRFEQVLPALRERLADNGHEAPRTELAQLLLQHVPHVIETLRQNPPEPHRSLHAVARSRLAEAVSDELLSRRRRERPEPWWSQLDQLSPPARRLFFKSLSPAQRAELRARCQGRNTGRNPATRRQHIYRAKQKLGKVLRAEDP